MSPFKSSAGRQLGKLIEGFKSSTIGQGLGAGSSTSADFELATVKSYSTTGSLVTTHLYTRDSLLNGITFNTVGYYTINFGAFTNGFDIRVWTYGGGGGRQSNGPGPGNGGAGNGVTGKIAVSSSDSNTDFTFIVGGGGLSAGASPAPGGFPDGGDATYNAHGGGGSSRFSKNEISFGDRDNASSVYHLIGAGGGGGIGYTSGGGTNDGRGGYPAGQPGGGYYPSDPQCYGRGATQSGGGVGGPAGRQPAGQPGGKYSGGNSGTSGGGAGGGGWYGGGGAGGYYATGGGGSGYIHPDVTETQGMNGSPVTRATDSPSYPAPGFDSNGHSRGDVDSDTITGAGGANGMVCIQVV